MAGIRTEGSINSDENSLGRSYRSGSRRRRIIQDSNMASMNVLSANFESLDYDNSENYLFLREEQLKGLSFIMQKNVCRWVIFLCIGIITAFVGIFIDIAIEEIAKIKYSRLKTYLDDAMLHSNLYVPYGIWMAFNIFPVLIGSLMVVYIEPMALGSGIPQVKCYLNGVKIPRIVRVKTLLVKTVGVITAVVGGLAGGKEGPMIHSGAVVAAGISQGKSTSLNIDFGILKHFRDDREKRDFVSGGAAAGVAAAFGAPVGGVLFSLEEGASFWNQGLTWRIFFASMVSTFTLNIVLSAYHGYPGHLSYPGLLNFGQFTNLSYELFELLIFIGIGAIGGLTGALYNYTNYRITLFRMRYMKKRYLKVLEAMIVAAVSGTVAILMIYFTGDCKPFGDDPTKYPVQMFCPDGQYNTAAALWLQVPEASVRSFFHDGSESIDISTMAVFAFVYYFLSIWTYGISVSAGLFIPCLLIGSAWGRLIGVTLQCIFPGQDWTSNVGKYALAGAAAQLGGVVRMTISLTAILIEATGSISFGLPLMLILLTAKWVGDFFTEGLYDIHIQLNGIPLLPWEPPPLSSNIYANEVMSYPVITFKVVENVGHIVDTLKRESYHGFVVVDPNERRMDDDSNEPRPNGRLRGLILRHQLIILLKNKVFNEVAWDFNELSVDVFRKQYPRYPNLEDVYISDEERNCSIDLSPFMNPSPYVVQHMTSLPRVFRLFRALGLRHVIVINDINEVVGIISRIDLARYRVHRHLGKISVEELKISTHF